MTFMMIRLFKFVESLTKLMIHMRLCLSRKKLKLSLQHTQRQEVPIVKNKSTKKNLSKNSPKRLCASDA